MLNKFVSGFGLKIESETIQLNLSCTQDFGDSGTHVRFL